MGSRFIDAIKTIGHLVSGAMQHSKRPPEEQAATRFQLDYDITYKEALMLIEALGIAETERCLQLAKTLGISIFHPMIMGRPHEEDA